MAKRILFTLTGFAAVLFFGNAIFNAPPVDEDYQQPVFNSTEVIKTPDVAAPISRPFALPVEGGADSAIGGDIYGDGISSSDDSAAADANSENNPSTGDKATEELQKSGAYQSAVSLAQKFVTAYGTYSPDQSAQEWVDSLPSLEKTAKASLLESAEGVWPQMVDRKASSIATPVSQSVTPVFSRQGGAMIQLSVTANKKTSYEGSDGFSSQSYAVTLKQGSSASSGWQVVAIS